jgi:hypothetical protein
VGSGIEAEILLSRLRAAGIPASMRPALGSVSTALGPIAGLPHDIFVRESDLAAARGLLPDESSERRPRRRLPVDLALLLPWAAIGLAAIVRALTRSRRS